jgi:carboxypeptidase C (cathepsin A)
MRGVLAALVALVLPAAMLAPVSAQQPATERQPGQGQTERPRGEQDARKLPPERTTRHEIPLGNGRLAFTVTLGAIPLYDGEGGPVIAEIGFVAVRKADEEATRRPLAFLLNGGPGAASVFLNIGGVGPWRLPLDTIAPSVDPAVVPNAETWLPFTDLVFLDPVGAGYSWTNQRGDDARRRFFSVDGDISALAVAIRKYVEREGRQASPKILVGESYGGFRVPKLARALQSEQGVGVRGLVMVSPVLDFGWRFQNRHTPLRWIAELPSMTAAARGGTITRESLADVEAYAATEYVADLLRGQRDRAALDRMSARVAGFTGLDPALVRRLGGRVEASVFVRERNRGQERIGSLYDALVTGLDPNPLAYLSRAEDPILDAVDAPLTAAMTDLYRQWGWQVDRPYRVLNREVGNSWMWGNRRSAPESLDDLRQAAALDPALRALVVHGATDLVTPYFESKLLIDQLPPLGDPDRIRLEVYPGGHMFYFREDARRALRDDVAALVAAATVRDGVR